MSIECQTYKVKQKFHTSLVESTTTKHFCNLMDCRNTRQNICGPYQWLLSLFLQLILGLAVEMMCFRPCDAAQFVLRVAAHIFTTQDPPIAAKKGYTYQYNASKNEAFTEDYLNNVKISLTFYIKDTAISLINNNLAVSIVNYITSMYHICMYHNNINIKNVL